VFWLAGHLGKKNDTQGRYPELRALTGMPGTGRIRLCAFSGPASPGLVSGEAGSCPTFLSSLSLNS
jgi:hypothetical protein